MKRPHKKGGPNRQTITGDIRKDISEKQLSHLGAVTLAFNEVEKQIELLFFVVTGLSGDLQYEVITRINGIDGRIGIIKAGIKSLELNSSEVDQFNEAFGDGVFKKYKSFRDAIIHARVTDGAVGMGLLVDRQAQICDVLLSEKALSILYEHLVALKTEFAWGANLLGLAKAVKNFKTADPNTGPFAAERAAWSVQFQARRSVRLALPPIPEFPSESELDEAASRWHKERQAEMTGWMQPFQQPARRARFVLPDEVVEPVPLPQAPTKMSPALHQAATKKPPEK